MNQHQKILNVLSDNRFHCTSEFAALYCIDYRRRLIDLKEKGYQLENRRCTKHPHPMKEWRLTGLPHASQNAPQPSIHPLQVIITAKDFLATFPSKKTPEIAPQQSQSAFKF